MSKSSIPAHPYVVDLLQKNDSFSSLSNTSSVNAASPASLLDDPLVVPLTSTTGVSLAVVALLFSSYAVYTERCAYLKYRPHGGKAGILKVPTMAPGSLPILGHGLHILFGGVDFFNSCVAYFGRETPFAVRHLNDYVFVIMGSKNTKAFWETSGSLMDPFNQMFTLKHMFGMRRNGTKAYESDDTGLSLRPPRGSAVAPHNRVDYLTHAGIVKNLGGARGKSLHTRWQKTFENLLCAADIGTEWVDMPDFSEFWQQTFGLALTETFFGPNLRRVNPNILSDLHRHDHNIPVFIRLWPRWTAWFKYALRDKLVDSFVQWHALARASFAESDVEADGNADPWWGSALLRDRGRFYPEIDGFDAKAHASADLGLFWATNSNIVPICMWQLWDVFRDESVLARVRADIQPALSTDGGNGHRLDIEQLKNRPLLQSVYSESLRLNSTIYCSRYTGDKEVQVNEWVFPKNSILLIPTHSAHQDETVWNTKDGRFPLDKFWADRFLVYEGDPSSGPGLQTASMARPDDKGSGSTSPRFTMDGVGGSYFPYGDGCRVCPGRFFAKNVMLVALALMVRDYDVDLLVKGRDWKPRLDPMYHGFGGEFPMDKIPFRIRKRARPKQEA